MTAQTVQEQVKNQVRQKIKQLQDLPEHPRKAALANLRRGVGRVPGDLPELWGSFLLGMPQELQSTSGEPTRAEWSIYLALTLYAMHQQGNELPEKSMNKEGVKFGSAVHRLVDPEDQPEKNGVFRRFNALATASSIREVSQHLRGMIQLLRANDIPLDYPQLAADLYNLQFPDSSARVRLRWGQDYYSYTASEKESSEE